MRSLLAPLSLLACLTLAAPVDAGPRKGPGALDRSFAGDGRAVVDLGGTSSVVDLAVQEQGRILVLTRQPGSNGALVALTRRGALDTSFASAGRLQLGFRPVDLVLAPIGEIYVTGERPGGGLVMRLSSEGVVDSKYGVAAVPTAAGAALQPDGKIVVGVLRSIAQPSPLADRWQVGATRLLRSGAPDPSFGSGGVALVATNAYSAGVPEVGVREDGMISVFSILASSDLKDKGSRWIVRLQPSGAPDPTLATPRRTAMDATAFAPGRLAFLPRLGNSVWANRADFDTTGREGDSEFVVGRLDSRGRADDSFGGDGETITDFGGREDGATAVTADRSGRTLAAGYTQASLANARLALARYTRGGRLDRGFGRGGRAVTGFAGASVRPDAIAVQGNGRIVVAASGGFSAFPAPPASVSSSIYLARFKGGTDRTPPRIRLAPIGDGRCAGRASTLRVRVIDVSTLARVTVRVDGKLVRATRSQRFRVRLRLDRAEHLIRIHARDAAGNRFTRTHRLLACG